MSTGPGSDDDSARISSEAEAQEKIRQLKKNIADLEGLRDTGGRTGKVASRETAADRLNRATRYDIRETVTQIYESPVETQPAIVSVPVNEAAGPAMNSPAVASVEPDAPRVDMRSTAGYSAVSTWDAFRRVDYKAQAVANSKAYMAQFNNLARTQMMQGSTLAQQAFEARQALRTATQNTLSPGGKVVSMAIEKQYTFNGQYAKYASQMPDGPAAPMDVYRKIIEASGSSNKWVSGLNTFTKYAGPIGTAVGLGASGYAIANAPSGQTGRVAAEEVGGFLGGIAGGVTSTAAVGGLALGAAAVGLTVAAPVVLIAGAAAGIAGAVYTSAYGREAGAYYYNNAWWKQ
jgi:hypothetical protein